MNNGSAASYQDNSAHGEDALLIRELSATASLDAVLDGVTHCEGAYASAFTQQLLQDAPIGSLEDLISVLEQSNTTLYQSGRGRSLLTTASVALKLGDQLHVVNAGDSPVYLLRGGELRELSTIVWSGIMSNLASGAVGLHSPIAYKHSSVTLMPEDRIILLTDGIIDNVSPEELAEILRGAGSPQEAVFALQETVKEKRRLHKGREDAYITFREDDLTIVFRYLD